MLAVAALLLFAAIALPALLLEGFWTGRRARRLRDLATRQTALRDDDRRTRTQAVKLLDARIAELEKRRA